MKRLPVVLAALFALPGLGLPALAQSTPQTKETRPPVVHQLRWISAEVLREILGGHTGTDLIQWGDNKFFRLWTNSRLNTLSVQGSPEFESFVDGTIRKFDVKPATIEFQFHVLKASTGEAGLKDGLPAFVEKVVKEIGALTRYNSFELIDSPLLRATAGNQSGIDGEGSLAYTIGLRPAQVVQDGDVQRIRVDGCRVEYRVLAGYTAEGSPFVATPEAVQKEAKPKGYQPIVKPIYRSAGVNTSFTIEDGETIVLGASRIPKPDSSSQGDNWAIITVLTAHILD